MRVVNVRAYGQVSDAQRAGVVYCGRPSPLGNPFTHKAGIAGTVLVASREEAIERYRRWLWEKLQARDPKVLAALKALTEESVLGCWCKPLGCHCDVLVRAWKWARSQRLV